jgi:hypothetical protein
MSAVTTEQESVLRIVDKHGKRHRDGCPASQVPLMLAGAVQELIANGTIEAVTITVGRYA